MVELSVPGEPQVPTPITLDKVQAALRVPVGAASPLWFMFAGAATAGMAFWVMTRWARPQNLEAMLSAAPIPDAPPIPAVAPALPVVAEPPAEPRSFAPAAEEAPEPVAELAPPPEAPPEPPIAAEPLTGAALVAEVARLTGLTPPDSMPDFEPEPAKIVKKAAKKPPPQT